jgi:hypothetical protein
MDINIKSATEPKPTIAPAPWTSDRKPGTAEGYFLVWSKTGCVIARVGGALMSYKIKSQAAIARLMAASPDLLDACETALAELNDPNRGPNGSLLARIKLRAAIKKAGGSC